MAVTNVIIAKYAFYYLWDAGSLFDWHHKR
jgi:hypothetical protein